ncbi:flavin reductase family protein [Flavobacteriales bacterium]|jgi:flavin reductase (DIM6/NTAB) family NADH-FMN oxidoreductase RutF|nr:flavin reductase family protein [Flavobacteriales bacterium]MDA7578058.1 flavin reductase family protein [Flavobacteriales bacterium]MDA7596230.1 flavin reductase family protein [Flavobacteriales bacterium]MDC0909177.1 flavin reductase family protein [Flavobacteriales bacterium]|tara:strand:- start:1097 stop:1936 length:840 start_codon:yes stop_codon:yes gene_type:complete
MIKTIDITNGETDGLYKYLSSAITPRPIALVSTIDKNGNKNLAPFSFFNIFSVNPPIMIFSPVKSARFGNNKDTLENVKQIRECVIGLVNENIAQQVSLASCSFDKDINEFEKAGLIEVKSDLVKPSRISESPINFECKVNDIITLGDEGGAGNLVLAQILKIHIDKSILDVNEDIDPFKLNIVSRYGGDWYGKTTKDSLYKIAKPISKVGMGVDRLPNSIKNSSILSGSDLAILASIEEVPIKNDLQSNTNRNLEEKHILAKQFLKEGNALEAWKILL